MARGGKPKSAQEARSGPLFADAPESPTESPPESADDVAPRGSLGGAAPHYHDHRARLRARFEAGGAGALADYELLELVLFRLIPRRDTKPLAKALLARFGDLAGVLGADAARLAEVDGAGPAVAADLKALQALFERVSRAEIGRRDVLSSWSAMTSYLRLGLQHAQREHFKVLFLDVKNQLIADETLAEGTIDQAPVYPREVVRRALELGAAGLVLAHNHPSGDPKPSPADIAITRDIQAAAKLMGIAVLDHVIVARHGAVSLRQLGLFKPA
jgi:DNA repair protein RadC